MLLRDLVYWKKAGIGPAIRLDNEIIAFVVVVNDGKEQQGLTFPYRPVYQTG
ncbi:hypothetical protein [Parapedobacter soli]|uniref:hypothetical protein n=1 Tax=Parapedobacter soli TaxID=416955 RepID=UPI0021C7914A|nr:hypothetical protein [Parapedobacter soli]